MFSLIVVPIDFFARGLLGTAQSMCVRPHLNPHPWLFLFYFPSSSHLAQLCSILSFFDITFSLVLVIYILACPHPPPQLQVRGGLGLWQMYVCVCLSSSVFHRDFH